MSDWIDVCPAADLPPGGRALVDVDGTPVAVFNLEGEYYAIHDVCSHDGAEIASGCLEGDEIVCPRHGARFCIRTGAVTKPPAYEDIAVFPVRLEGGAVQVRDDRWD
ncbi:non-heme iron oxygenase ferredoxin subunit [Methylogaea oryzae]|uniref:(2Fe-2S)-binding protein n=1 Tax=Methylogaea oryzae TaxID=1295382 RepID=A0A8D4VSY0_9GAMM|nr:non-heme iron oxygenase ferredoxin subunit [Methylogaea oryzae]BBL71997.1 (2Fe-2S)-binding protein [Methylogaea oryzae]